VRFLWPEGLWLLAVAAFLAVAYVAVRRRPARTGGLQLEGADAGVWRRHVPPAMLLAGLILALLAVARPSAMLTLPSEQRVIILAVDVSLSMRATDIQPTRLGAAQAAAKAFVRELPPDVRIGVVSFAGTAMLVQQPTNDRDELVAAIERLQLDRQTAIGSGIVMSLATLFPGEGIDLESMVLGARQPLRETPQKATKQAKKSFKPVPPASNDSAAIVLLTDGRRTTGPDPLEAARMAAERGIRVFTVGFGTTQGGMAPFEGYSIYMMFDEETLKAIAGITHAEYFHATTADELTRVYAGLSSRLVLEKKQTEMSALFAAAAALLVAAAAALSLAWFNRIL